MSPEHISQLVSAYLDGEVSEREKRAVERLLQEDAGTRRLYDELRRNREVVGSLPRHAAPQSIFADVQSHTERSALLDDLHGTSDARTWRFFRRLVPLATAASLAFAAFFGWWYFDQRQEFQGRGDRVGFQEADSSEPVPREQSRAIAAAPTVEQRLKAGVKVAELEAHPFAAEPVVVQVAVADTRTQAALADKVSRRLSAAKLVDLSQVSRKDQPAASAGQNGFFLRGKAGSNAIAPGEEQLLVRASPDQIAQVFRELPESAGESPVELKAGTLNVRGRERSQQVLQVLSGAPAYADAFSRSRARTEPVAAARAEGESKPVDATRTADEKFLDDLLRGVGIDPELLLAKRPGDRPVERGAPPPEPGTLVARREEAAQPSTEPGQTPLDVDAAAKGDEQAVGARRLASKERNAELPAVDDAAAQGTQDPAQFVTFILQIITTDKATAPPHPTQSDKPRASGR